MAISIPTPPDLPGHSLMRLIGTHGLADGLPYLLLRYVTVQPTSVAFRVYYIRDARKSKLSSKSYS